MKKYEKPYAVVISSAFMHKVIGFFSTIKKQNLLLKKENNQVTIIV